MVLPHDDRGAGPAVVLLHAGIADRTMWADHLGPIADAGYRVVAPDLGSCSAPWADVLETLEDLGVDRAFLVGDSFGAAVALSAAVLARRHRERRTPGPTGAARGVPIRGPRVPRF
jgi:3-oxoadipate enol-lactonase